MLPQETRRAEPLDTGQHIYTRVAVASHSPGWLSAWPRRQLNSTGPLHRGARLRLARASIHTTRIVTALSSTRQSDLSRPPLTGTTAPCSVTPSASRIEHQAVGWTRPWSKAKTIAA